MNHQFLEINKSGETMALWVSRNGGQVLTTSNSFEKMRFISNGETVVIYEGRRGVNYNNYKAKSLYWSFVGCEDVPLGKKTKYKKTSSIVLNSILERDGNNCFYCAIEFSQSRKPTIEHLVARAHQGPDHISNKFAACFECNSKAGHLSAPEKIKLRDNLRWHELSVK